MPQIAKHRPGDQSLSAADWNSIADSINGGLGQKPPPLNTLGASTVLVRNDTGADLDRYDCISLGAPLWTLENDGSVDLIFAGEDADPDKPAAILTEPIAHDATNKRFGRAWIYGLAYAAVGPAAAITDLTAAPDPANARLAPGSGNVQLLAAPSTTVETLLPVLLGAGGGTQHFLFTLTGTISGGAGAATIRNMPDTAEIDTGASVKDPLGHFSGLVAGYRGVCVKEAGEYYALGPYVIDVRYVHDTALEQSRKSGTYTNIETPEVC